jgi:VIT1/CCC1 family predicted Fe2+/Mn2+ transporter
MTEKKVTPHPGEAHKSHRSAWLRAAVLGVNDGIVSVSSLMLGISAAHTSSKTVLTAGIAGLFAGGLSMAVGEYVSVSSQKDSERADIAIEKRSLEVNPKEELEELVDIYIKRGLSKDMATKVALQLHEHDALTAHIRDELGIDHESLPNPLLAATASSFSFSIGAFFPILAALIVKSNLTASSIVIVSLLALAVSGGVGAFIGGGNRFRAAMRVFAGGGAAMAVTAFIGHLVGHSL